MSAVLFWYIDEKINPGVKAINVLSVIEERSR